MSEDKKIKLGFSVDKQGLLEAKSAIGSLTQEVKKLADELQKAGAMMAYLGGGRSGNPLFSGVTSKSAGGAGQGNNSITTANTKVGIGSGIASDAVALRDTARAGTEALRQMTGGMKDSIGAQIREIARLKKELVDLNQEFDKASKGGTVVGSHAIGI